MFFPFAIYNHIFRGGKGGIPPKGKQCFIYLLVCLSQMFVCGMIIKPPDSILGDYRWQLLPWQPKKQKFLLGSEFGTRCQTDLRRTPLESLLKWLKFKAFSISHSFPDHPRSKVRGGNFHILRILPVFTGLILTLTCDSFRSRTCAEKKCDCDMSLPVDTTTQ